MAIQYSCCSTKACFVILSCNKDDNQVVLINLSDGARVVRQWISALVLLTLTVLFDQAIGQTIGTCVVIQSKAETAQVPIDLKAVASCETVGMPAACRVEIVPTAPDLILDVNDVGTVDCVRLTDETDPCLSVDSGPLIFHSQQRATQYFSGGSDRVRMTALVRQKRLRQTTIDQRPSEKFALVIGETFDVLKEHSSAAVRLECSMVDGDETIFPIVGEADLSPKIQFVSKNSSERAFDILTYRVTK